MSMRYSRAWCVSVLVAACAGQLAAQAVTATPVDTLMAVGPATYDCGRARPVMLRGLAFVAPLFGTQTCDLVSWNGFDWVPVLPSVVLPMLGTSLQYDAVHDRLFAFDGKSALWTVAGTTAAPFFAVPSPIPLLVVSGRALVHDAARDELVVFGGQHVQGTTFPVTVYHDETYVFRQGSWQLVNVAVRPSARAGAAIAYDPVRQRSVLFGGVGGTLLADTWEWDGLAWTSVNAIGPAAGSASGAFDFASQRVVVRDRTGAVWAFDGVGWLPISSGSALLPGSTPPVYDGQTLLVVGGTSTGFPSHTTAETWRLAGNGWQRVPESVHLELTGQIKAAAYDAARCELVAVHGDLWSASTWLWNGAWRQHPGAGPFQGAMAFDEARGEVVLFGGATGGETWTWNGSTWLQRAPAASPPATPSGGQVPIAYDPVRQVVMLVTTGGSWLWNGSNWSPAPGTQPPIGTLLVWDPVRAVAVLLVAGATTWEWNGIWRRVSGPLGPQFVRYGAFDPTRNRVFAYSSANGVTTEHEWTGSAWLPQAPPVPLRADYAGAMVLDACRARLLFRGVVDPAQGSQLHVLGPTPSRVEDLGGGCANGLPLQIEQRPAVGATWELYTRVDPTSFAAMLLALYSGSWPVGNCSLLVDGTLGVLWTLPGPSGACRQLLAVPPTPALRGQIGRAHV